ncbi:aminomethyl-transferring glycine dehydrogenase subunit GcvPA [Salinisphaera sp. LB1]|uniref:aminomethyl-transferring glycine dehydrogenase subunit GcvPA n=1 Tax=Salinisphaera sp. LB1 TaxID=2183911 RepID=UPI000D70651C|nr:aminomethyl-transferring glycine dehydrogenase subunit GcvPA [Salinisphaera sp. LB1]AWN17799.1 Glycine dehydrogenase [decarboxylating] (glycine cleavage system P1 protein) [Salinisphaera sp. LB1]
MPFIPHTDKDITDMLAAIGADSVDALFSEIDPKLRDVDISAIPERASEQAVTRLMHQRAARDTGGLCFIGAGAYEHHVPAAVWEITTRGEFYSAYTPYQAEASQGTLQVVYEYQTMVCGLTGMDVANASLYDGASALAEAVLMAVRANRKSKSRRMLMPASVHPYYREVAHNICANQNIIFESIAFGADGKIDRAALDAWTGEDITALVIPQPNFFGVLEDVDALTDWARDNGALAIGVVNPVSLALLSPPGEWGDGAGADIVVGEGQPLGAPLAGGGPYFGILCCRKTHVRQMPGRVVGRTRDMDGKPGYVLTLQPREQHIRRSKATSNICTNQGLLVTAATIHMSLLGSHGLETVAATCAATTRDLVARLTALDGVARVFNTPFFHEAALRLPVPAQPVLDALAERGILGGLALGEFFDGMDDVLLVCATETKTDDDLAAYANALSDVLAEMTEVA